MKKEEILILAQLLTAIKDSIVKLEEAQKQKDSEQMALAKKEILNFQRQIDEIL
ncbi:MAG: hypothetical protein AABX73_03400 [Nanoarchaeota archaeon]